MGKLHNIKYSFIKGFPWVIQKMLEAVVRMEWKHSKGTFFAQMAVAGLFMEMSQSIEFA